jgi:hypothetical protein
MQLLVEQNFDEPLVNFPKVHKFEKLDIGFGIDSAGVEMEQYEMKARNEKKELESEVIDEFEDLRMNKAQSHFPGLEKQKGVSFYEHSKSHLRTDSFH